MAITFHPKPGQILMCDFTYGFREPEMIKNRPVIVLTPSMAGRMERRVWADCRRLLLRPLVGQAGRSARHQGNSLRQA